MSSIFISALCPSFRNDPGVIEQAISRLESNMNNCNFRFYIDTQGILKPFEGNERLNILKGYLSAGQKLPLLCNGNEKEFSTFSGFILNVNYGLIEELLIVRSELDEIFIKKLKPEALVSLIGDSLDSYYINSGYKEYLNPVQNQIQFNNLERQPLLGLPKLADLKKYNIGPADRPAFFSWINYWSNSVAEEMGFKYEEDKSLFDICHSTEQGWLLQITKEPLNLEIPEHLEKLKAAYNRFKKVGGQDLLK